MSSDTFHISITQVDGAEVTLSCVTSTAGGHSDLAMSRSFVLMCLFDAMPESSPLMQALSGLDYVAHITDEAFYREHLDRFIAGSWLMQRENVLYDEHRRWALLNELNALADSGTAPAGFDVLEELEKQFPRHRFVIRARMADPRWLEGLGHSSFGTTAYDVWYTDPAMNSVRIQAGTPFAGDALRGIKFSGVTLSDLSASTDGRRIFARGRHNVELDPPDARNQWSGPLGAGSALAFDAESLTVQAQMPLDALLSRDRCDVQGVRFMRHSPRGDALWICAGSKAVCYMFEDERRGELVDVAHCTSSGYFSDVAWAGDSGDSALVSYEQDVETRHAHTEWPNVHATHAVMDDERIATVGKRELAVFDRRARKERFRVKSGESWQVALLPNQHTALIAGPYGKKQLRVFDADGNVVHLVKMTYGAALKASPSGILAILDGSALKLFDLQNMRLTLALSDSLCELAWLGSDHLAVLYSDGCRLAVLDVREAFARGKPLKIEGPQLKKPKS